MTRRSAISRRLSAILDTKQHRRAVTRPAAIGTGGLFCLVLGLMATVDTRAQSQPQIPTPNDEGTPEQIWAAKWAEDERLAPPLPDRAKAVRGLEIMEKSRAAYAALTSYRGRTETRDINDTNKNPSPSSGGSADITWLKPNLIYITGKDSRNDPYTIIGNEKGAWERWAPRKKNAWEKTTIDMAIAGMTGVAALAPTTIPQIFTEPLPWVGDRDLKRVFLEKEETIQGHECFKLTAATADDTISWWIDKELFLLRRRVSTQTAEQVARLRDVIDAEMQARARRDNRPYTPEPKTKVDGSTLTEEFEIQALNEPVDKNLFKAPEEG